MGQASSAESEKSSRGVNHGTSLSGMGVPKSISPFSVSPDGPDGPELPGELPLAWRVGVPLELDEPCLERRAARARARARLLLVVLNCAVLPSDPRLGEKGESGSDSVKRGPGGRGGLVLLKR